MAMATANFKSKCFDLSSCLFFRRKKSLPLSCDYSKEEKKLVLPVVENLFRTQSQHQHQPPYVSELRQSLDMDDKISKSDSENIQVGGDSQLVRPSEIRKFVRSNSLHKIEIVPK